MSAPQLAPGTVVAQKYQLGTCLGFGGSSATYQAVASDGREVVLKIFDPAIRQRADIMGAIEQTYAATNALPQDIVAPLLDAGYDPTTGAPFGVSERIAFPSLTQVAGQLPLSPEQVGRLLGVLSTLLGQAHARQLFHHALKPNNVFVGFASGRGVKVTDFGAGLARTAVPTQEGYGLAAPWLAPEQVQGQTPAGAAADVFTTGLLVFFALTGRSYWRSCQGTFDMQGWQRELLSPRTPPSARARELGVPLKVDYDGVLGCALSIDAGQRYRSIAELSRAFESLLAVPDAEGQATMAFPVSAYGGVPSGGGGYPPPPTPAAGGYGAPPPPAASNPGYGAPAPQPAAGQPGQPGQPGAGQYPWGSQDQGQPAQGAPPPGYQAPMPGQPAPGQPGQPGQVGAYVSTQTQDSALGETAAGRPLDPAVAQRRGGSTSRLAPVLVGLVAVVLLGGAAAAFIVMGRRGKTDPQAAASASAPIAVPIETAAAAPPDSASAAPSAAPAETASAAPADSAAAGPTGVEATITCLPDCDEIRVDDKPLDTSKPIFLDPGKHVLTASKNGYLPVKETLFVKPGQKVERMFTLKEKPAAPTAGPGPGPTPTGPAKPCGKFLKRAGCK